MRSCPDTDMAVCCQLSKGLETIKKLSRVAELSPARAFSTRLVVTRLMNPISSLYPTATVTQAAL